jgi:hypothetical protein
MLRSGFVAQDFSLSPKTTFVMRFLNVSLHHSFSLSILQSFPFGIGRMCWRVELAVDVSMRIRALSRRTEIRISLMRPILQAVWSSFCDSYQKTL